MTQQPDTSYEQILWREGNSRDITRESALLARKSYIEQKHKVDRAEAEKAAAEAEARGEKPPEPYKGYDLVVAKTTSLEDARKIKQERWYRLGEEAESKSKNLFAERSMLSRLWMPTFFGLAVTSLVWE
jgi:hypothetical protein